MVDIRTDYRGDAIYSYLPPLLINPLTQAIGRRRIVSVIACSRQSFTANGHMGHVLRVRSIGSSVIIGRFLAKMGNMPKAIIAIGGGEIRTRGTVPIDREIIRLTNKKHPRLLFIPTASSDSERYWEHVQEYFGGFLKCNTDVLLLRAGGVSKKEIVRKIGWADIIYVGGGNTLYMMRVWRRCGVDQLLRRAYENGTVLSGISAGAICWFDSGHSDSMSFSNPRNWNYINVKGLGLIKGILCPHYNSRTRGVPRRKDFRNMIRRTGGVGIATENNCAIEFIDGRFYKLITSKRHARAYRVYKGRGQVLTERIPKQEHLASIELLYRRRGSGC